TADHSRPDARGRPRDRSNRAVGRPLSHFFTRRNETGCHSVAVTRENSRAYPSKDMERRCSADEDEAADAGADATRARSRSVYRRGEDEPRDRAGASTERE